MKYPIAKLNLFFLLVIISYLGMGRVSFGAELLFIDGEEHLSNESQQVYLAGSLYGLTVRRYVNDAYKKTQLLYDELQRSAAHGVVINATALKFLDMKRLLDFARKNQIIKKQILLIGLTPENHNYVLPSLSGNVLIDCIQLEDSHTRRFYQFTKIHDIAFELRGQRISSAEQLNVKHYGFNIKPEREFTKIIEIVVGNTRVPIFIMTSQKGQQVYYLAGSHIMDRKDMRRDEKYGQEQFIEIAPLLMFIKAAYGDMVWHGARKYANFTVDDPWLVEPYGNLSYIGLLNEMKKAKFHTTIAFVPWNFDRNRSNIVELLKKNPDSFSICIHGNNHDHREFYRYKTNFSDPMTSKSLSDQEANIQQAIARMERMKALTGLSYDRVMVFPHSIAPEKTLGLLKKYNFLATTNESKVPLDSVAPNDPEFQFRSVTTFFKNFPSLRRVSLSRMAPFINPHIGRGEMPGINSSQLAFDLFLDNPVIFYAHQDFFKDGMDGFNKIAREINEIQPEVKWASLGEIAEHLYLQRRREDGGYDVLTFSSTIVIENPGNRAVKYYVRRQETFEPSVSQVLVNDGRYPYRKSDGCISLMLTVPAGASRRIQIEYENNLRIATVAVGKNNLRVYLLRLMSDFRDRIISRHAPCRYCLDTYYSYGLYRFGLIVIFLAIFLGGFVIFAMWYFYKAKMAAKQKAAAQRLIQ